MKVTNSNEKLFLGIDIGSVALSIALLNEHSQIIDTSYTFHQGQITEKLHRLLKAVDSQNICTIGYTSSGTSVISQGTSVDTRIAYITAAKHLHPDLQSLLIIGAEKFGLVVFDAHGEYLNFHSNSSCAAGTGNFLDQQAERLNLNDIQEFSRIAYENRGNFPKIASRCAVFAKTDLIHAQQEGYYQAEICDGLSYGVAKNIVDKVFQNQSCSHVIAAGGVALNKAVIRHIEQLTYLDIAVDPYAQVYGAIGAALNGKELEQGIIVQLKSPEDLVITKRKAEKQYYPPLLLELSDYPDFEAHQTYKFTSRCFPAKKPVEVDVYDSFNNQTKVYLGIDIGSTSTKAVLLGSGKNVLAGFYTRTSGQPLQAVQVIFEAIDQFAKKRNIHLTVLGASTTGSGRKFTGKIIGADTILNEITAHARAAYELDPDTDTIIEIGGQDSKFTTMRDGMVTFSVMNNVCAAGTGSFIEEQAKRLGCPLSDYAERVENVHAPMASDRCTVFMERDLNHYLMAGYSTDEILAAVLHSTRENYLTKVAVKGYIGEKIFFQGATAKNKGLIAAFEQKLKKPIMVSRYCHLTGAIGVALTLLDQQIHSTKFRGLDLYKESIPIRSEVCDLCTNHCKLKIAEIDGQIEAYGFLCGRDYQDNKFVRDKSVDFNLIRLRNKLFRFKATTKQNTITIGIPSGLHLFEETLFWRLFFDFLSIRTVTSEKYPDVIKDGKNLNHAEFCSPIAAMHGHVHYLSDKADYIFLPVYLESQLKTEAKKQYCYYTQFVSSVISAQKKASSQSRYLTPMLNYSNGELSARYELFRMLSSIGLNNIGFIQVAQAYEKARKQAESAKDAWKAQYLQHKKDTTDIQVMLLGRPYTVLSPAMNNSIPDIFEKMGIKTFFMDMLPDHPTEKLKLSEPVKNMQWKFASKILDATDAVAKTDHCYPVLITSFKCTPDAFVIEYFKDLLEAAQKPYLILQLDEHDSSVGYETRIEAAIKSFRNHRERQQSVQHNSGNGKEEKNNIPSGNHMSANQRWQAPVKTLINEARQILKAHSIDFDRFSRLSPKIKFREDQLPKPVFNDANLVRDKTLLLPNWDPYSGPLLEAMLQHNGVNAKLVKTTDESIQRSLSTNTGQCLPLSIIVQNAIDCIEENGLKPSETVLWIMKSDLSCSLSMFPYFMKKLLDNYGQGMEKVSVFRGHISFFDFSLSTAIDAYLAYMFGGYIRKIACGIRPYEKQKGLTDETIQKAMHLLYHTFRYGKPKDVALARIIDDFESIEVEKTAKAKVAIFGDLYVRDNDLMNQDLIKTVEAHGGEVITTPYSEYIKIIINTTTKRFFKRGLYSEYLKMKFLKSLIPLVEDKYRKFIYNYNGETKGLSSDEIDDWLARFGINMMHRGESLENLLKIYVLMKQHPDLDLFIQTNPSYCCPSLVTEAMSSKIEELTGVPVVSIEYDGTSGIKNDNVIPFLKYRKKKVLVKV
jgi:predicted CoA-substrate-specific enzyme activase